MGLGLRVPDSAFAHRARELAAELEPAFLLNHSIRAYAWAVALADRDGLAFDTEILYVSAVLHDLGLVPGGDLGGCFEFDGAVQARAFAIRHGQPAERAERIHDVIALHMAEDLAPDAPAEVPLLWDSTGVDVSGHRFADVPPSLVGPVLAAYPRLRFKRAFAELFADQAARKPPCRVAAMVAAGSLERIAAAPFDE
ncbi:MAG TPA: HD domain-containing protein [Candidatus Limnocylindrales bacterium]|nr:HD domain-containing protein [Candidatus Limnocylindrales bacterium]